MELRELLKIASEKNIEIKEIDDLYMLFNTVTNDFENYWSLDCKFDAGDIFTLEEASEYLINF